MLQPQSGSVINRDQYEAILLELDGVITDMASVRATCWKRMFDEDLKTRAARTGELFRPFEVATDYRMYVHGKPRFDGVRDFLRSRDLELPEGSPNDSPHSETVCGLGNRKNELVNRVLEDVGVESYQGTVKLIQKLRGDGFKIAVVTSSRNRAAVLKAAKVAALFDTQVDGNVIHSERLAGKPAPDTFLLAAKRLGVEPALAIVIEDVISGVEAGANANFGLAIGVARKGNAEELSQHGADVVVNDLGELLARHTLDLSGGAV